MKTIVYSLDRTFYYVKEGVCPWCNWISVKKFQTKEEADRGWVSDVLGITLKDGTRYYRSVLPFAFWKVKEGKEEVVEDTDELVLDYVGCSRHRT